MGNNFHCAQQKSLKKTVKNFTIPKPIVSDIKNTYYFSKNPIGIIIN